MEFVFDPEYDERLYEARHVGFETVLEAISTGRVLLDVARREGDDPSERVLVVDLDDAAYCVPYVVTGSQWRLQTVYPATPFNNLLKTARATARGPAFLNDEEREIIDGLRNARPPVSAKPDASALVDLEKSAAKLLKRRRKGRRRISPDGPPGSKEQFGEIAGRIGKIGRW